MTNQVVQQRGARQEETDTLRILKFFKMNSPILTGSISIEDPNNIIEDLKKVFYVMLVAHVERVEIAAYQLSNVSRTLFDQRKKSRVEDAPHLSWTCFEEVFLGIFFP